MVDMPRLRRIKSRLVVEKPHKPRLPSMTISPGSGFSASTICAPQVPWRNDFEVDHALEDAVRARAKLVIIFGEGDRGVDDRGAELARLLHGLDRIRQHVGRVHHRLHGLMERAALGGEIVLIFDEHERSRFRIHRLTPSDFAPHQGRVERSRYIWTNSAPKASEASPSSAPPCRRPARSSANTYAGLSAPQETHRLALHSDRMAHVALGGAHNGKCLEEDNDG